MRLFNSKTNQLETFVSIKENEVSMYVCGPTVYGDIHIGNTRPLIVFDTLRNTFEALGYKVSYISNITDVDDKIINKAIEEKVSEKEITHRYSLAYEQIRQSLHAQRLSKTPKVTESMDAIIAFIDDLVKKDFAYNVNGNVYFRVNKADTYGEISHQRIDDLIVGSRVDEDSDKENPLDFSLWKKTEVGIQWDSPWGQGRPGWHTECVVMINDYFHQEIDIHGGGMDLKFPHHENEVAQAHACLHHGLAHTWMHNGMLNIDGEKMSKSLGNTLLAKDAIQNLGGNVVRWLMLSSHYRAPINITEELIENAKIEVNKAEMILKQVESKSQLIDFDLNAQTDSDFFPVFLEALSDDLNTPNAMRTVFDQIKALNALIRQKEWTTEVAVHWHSLRKMLSILGIEIEELILSDEDKNLFAKWNQAKAERDFDQADQLRSELSRKNLI